ncbi:uncharacterized protein [Arachis hypogaea]|uniref:uncharacterized protein isoform X1 n=1 Tax=Arachis hypogaea TaxID=3818 RepID=UPI000DECA99A|nr:uncharacterized protein LOC112695147 isoform X1 [Arachis hypogaea]
MDTKEEAEPLEDKASSPILQKISEGSFKVAGEASKSMYSGDAAGGRGGGDGNGNGNGGGGSGCIGGVGVGSRVPQKRPSLLHRRAQTELFTQGIQRVDSFQKLKAHVNKAFRWGNRFREPDSPSSDSPSHLSLEVMANQKRQWYQLHPKSMDCVNYKEPTTLFEHFVILGLHPDTNLDAVEHAFARRKRWQIEKEKSEYVDYKMPKLDTTLEPQILFKYPLGKKLTVPRKELCSFCFPEGVKASMLERTPSLSELNELVYGQEHLGRDDLSFIFTLKAADSATLYGVCLHVPEIVQRPPGILDMYCPPSPRPFSSRFLVSAPRCYCLLTKVPFFELHFEMLYSLIAQERLNRITQFVNELNLTGGIPTSKPDDQVSLHVECPETESFSDWMSFAIPVEGAAVITAAAAGILSDDEVIQLSPKVWESPKIWESPKRWDSCSQSPASMTASDASEFFLARDIEKDGRKNVQGHDNCAVETTEIHDSTERTQGNGESDQLSPKFGTPFSARSCELERLESLDSLASSTAKSVVWEDDDDLFANNERDYGDGFLIEFPTEKKNDLLQIVHRYHSHCIPPRGTEFIFHPLEHLQAIQYIRHSVEVLGFSNSLNSSEPAQAKAKLAAAEEAFALSIWTTATTCRVLSLESMLSLFTGVLLEKQVVVVCPNLGVLSAIVLCLIPMIRPFQWQSLFLPVLPGSMLDFLDAPVPYIVGIQRMPDDSHMKTNNLVLVNATKNQVKMCQLPKLPQYRELYSQLSPIHAKLKNESSHAKRHPIHRCNEAQAKAATQFLNVVWHYLESLCSDLKSHTITSVQSNNDRVSLLLKETFIDSFPNRDQLFMKLFVDTQLFSVLSDSRISSFERGQL